MKIYWKDKRTKDLFEDEIKLRKFSLDSKEIKSLFKAMQNLNAVDSVKDLPKNLHCHSIKEGRKFICFAVDLPSVGGKRGKNRIIFKPPDESEYDLSDLKSIQSIEILGIINYHK